VSTTPYVSSSDSRLTDARTPTTHGASHTFGGSDQITVSQAQVDCTATTIQGIAPTPGILTNALSLIDTQLTNRAATQLTTNALVGTTASRIVVTGSGGAVEAATIGSGLTLSGGTLTASGGGGGGSSVGSDLYLWATFR